MYKAALILLIGLQVSCASSTNLGESKQIKSREIYAIYDGLLERYAGDSKIRKLSIVRNTGKAFDKSCLEKSSDGDQFHSAVTSFGENNSIQHELLASFKLSFPYELADELEQVGGVRAPPKGQSYKDFLQEQLAKLKKRADEGYEQVLLSAPGVSEDGSIAIVYVGVSYAGSYYALNKIDGRWSVKRSLSCGWIS